MSRLEGSGLPAIDTNRAHPARVYDYLLGGKDNFAADQVVAEQVKAAIPSIAQTARANRAFLQRAVRYLAVLEGLRALRLAARPSDRNPIHSTALDKAIAATLPDERSARSWDARACHR